MNRRQSLDPGSFTTHNQHIHTLVLPFLLATTPPGLPQSLQNWRYPPITEVPRRDIGSAPSSSLLLLSAVAAPAPAPAPAQPPTPAPPSHHKHGAKLHWKKHDAHDETSPEPSPDATNDQLIASIHKLHRHPHHSDHTHEHEHEHHHHHSKGSKHHHSN